MMNSFLRAITCVLFWQAISFTLTATQKSCSDFAFKTAPCFFSQPLLEVKTGYFFFSNSKMNKIYDQGGWDVQLCASCPLGNLTHQWTLDLYSALEYFQRSGYSLKGNQHTSIWSVPISIGLKPIYAIDANKKYYFTVGARYYYLHQHNRSSYVYKNISGKDLGFFVNTGFNYLLYDRVVFDIFGEYSYANMRMRSENCQVYTTDIQIGGFAFGGGLGYEF